MKIAIGSDHAGYHLKARVIEYLSHNGYEVMDLGPYDSERADY
ncbi:MAG: RpiB/LacA/LacB family sugar-phosphate isomerase, partial [Bacillota bacterium]|nr:RpiB/LacA/LacB family sugar-phosphate isomerase [Bacillota bacterium]